MWWWGLLEEVERKGGTEGDTAGSNRGVEKKRSVELKKELARVGV
jgi:hypothetical protein